MYSLEESIVSKMPGFELVLSAVVNPLQGTNLLGARGREGGKRLISIVSSYQDFSRQRINNSPKRIHPACRAWTTHALHKTPTEVPISIHVATTLSSSSSGSMYGFEGMEPTSSSEARARVHAPTQIKSNQINEVVICARCTIASDRKFRGKLWDCGKDLGAK